MKEYVNEDIYCLSKSLLYPSFLIYRVIVLVDFSRLVGPKR